MSELVRVAEWGGRQILYLPMYVALEEGYFDKLGLKVEIYYAGNDDEIHAEVAAKKADFGVGDPAFVAVGAAHGADTRVISAMVNAVCVWGFTHHPEIHDLHQLSDFVGLRFGGYPGPSTVHSLIYNIKAKQPRRLRTMEIVEGEVGNTTGLLASGLADVVVEIEPMVSMAEQQGLRVVLSLGDFYPNMLFSGVMSSLAVIEERPKVVEKFVLGIQQGLTTCHRNPEAALAVTCKLFPAVSRECLSRAIERMLHVRAWPEQALIEASAWQQALQLRRDLEQLGDIKDPIALLEQRFAYAAITGAI